MTEEKFSGILDFIRSLKVLSAISGAIGIFFVFYGFFTYQSINGFVGLLLAGGIALVLLFAALVLQLLMEIALKE
jgi:hypothetical protein